MSAARKEIAKLIGIARKRGSRPDAEDAVAEALAAFWERGCKWTEGRLVLEVKSRMRNRRRAEQTRQKYEQLYAVGTGGGDE